MPEVRQGTGELFNHSQYNFYLTFSRILVASVVIHGLSLGFVNTLFDC